MYHGAGNFGQVRVAGLVPTLRSKGLFSLNSVGWHRCNDLYRITRPQGCEFPLLLITTGGCGAMSIQGASLSLPPGSLAFIPRNIPNSYRTPEGGMWEFYWLHPCGPTAEAFLDALAQRQIYLCSFTAGNSYEQRMEKLIKLCAQSSPLRLSQSLSELLHLAAMDLLGKKGPMSLPLRAAAYIEAHFHEPLPITELAGELFVSPAHLIRIFKQEHGCTPLQYQSQFSVKSGSAHSLRSCTHRRLPLCFRWMEARVCRGLGPGPAFGRTGHRRGSLQRWAGLYPLKAYHGPSPLLTQQSSIRGTWELSKPQR